MKNTTQPNHRRKSKAKKATVILATILSFWGFLTIWAEWTGRAQFWEMGDPTATKEALVVFDPDPFYNLDEHICHAFAEGLSAQKMRVRIETVAAANTRKEKPFDLYVFCANTYNWQPDWAISEFIKKQNQLKGKEVVAITIGAGSTNASQKTMNKTILNQGANLIDSRTFWLMRPNDESRPNEKNVAVAKDMANNWGLEIGGKIATELEEAHRN